MTVAMLTAGCETIEHVKAALLPDSASTKPAPVVEAGPAKRVSATEATAAKKAASHLDPPAATPAPAPAPARAAAQALLEEGIKLYDSGDFNAAIKRLNAAEVSSSDKSTQTRALKYLAFSYCVTGRQVPCRQRFEKALKIDPAFDLGPGERGHPLWSVAFDRAKQRK